MIKPSSYLPRRQEITETVQKARADCGTHWLVSASATLEIPPRTLSWLCRKWRVFYTSRQYYRKNKQSILDTIHRCQTLEDAARQLGIPRSTLYRLRKKWEGARTKRRGRNRVTLFTNDSGKTIRILK